MADDIPQLLPPPIPPDLANASWLESRAKVPDAPPADPPADEPKKT
jgi:hypothetical protein